MMFRLIFNVSCLLLVVPHFTLAFTAATVGDRHHLRPLHNIYNGGTMKSLLQQQRRPVVHSCLQQQQQSDVGTTIATSSSVTDGKFDGAAVIKYGIAITVQMIFIGTLFRIMDLWIVPYIKTVATGSSIKISRTIPFVFNCMLFYGLALKSRVFNPMSNTRPQVKTLEVATPTTTTTTGDEVNNQQKPKDVAAIFKRKLPKWTPPGIVFPIVWLLIVGPIRAITSSMIYSTIGSYASLPILSYIFHLCIGDVWNTINNVERRFGVAVTGVLCVWLSKAHAVYQYYRIDPLAGTILGLTLIWLTIATALVTATWQLNPSVETGQLEPLVPIVGNKGPTKFAWFSSRTASSS